LPSEEAVGLEPPVAKAVEPEVTAPKWSERWGSAQTAIICGLPALLMAAGVLWIVGTLWQLVGWRRSHGRMALRCRQVIGGK
jgi:hypothetical protein